MNDEAPREPQRAPGISSWPFTAVCCGHFLLAGWAAHKIVPISAAFFVGLGLSVSSGLLLFHLLLNHVWLIVAGMAMLLALARHVGVFSEQYRRPVNLLLIAAIGFAPTLLASFALVQSGAFHLTGRLAQ
ncbi:MAG TPA: hypothetical protein VKB90_07625 [Candidatus Acidoferrum sp.]|nr:hypothetical protein [Candidatus Acidoferrum sp.]